jgi:hypothetical protein
MHDVPVAAKHHAAIFEAVARGDEKSSASDALMDYAAEITRRSACHWIPEEQPEHLVKAFKTTSE